MVIDTHVHIGRGERLSDTYQVDCLPEAIIAAMDEAGVDMSCVMPVYYADYEKGIQEVREAVAARPKRLVGYARVNLQDERRALEQIRRCFDDYGFRGLKLHPGMGDGFPTRASMDLLSEYGRPLLLHATAELGFADAVAHLARQYPRVPVICGHMGGFGVFHPGFVKLYALEAKQIPNLYLDTAFVFLHQWIRIAMDICGPEKILFASDGPVAHPAISLRQIELCRPSDAERALILGENARRLLGI